MSAAEKVKPCGLCALCQRPDVQGRQHGKGFLCTPCESLEKLVQRHIGGLPSEFTAEDKADFFSKAVEKTDGRHRWDVVRGVFRDTCVQRKVFQAGTDFAAPYRPLSYWTKKGYEESAVKQCPCKQDTVHGKLYKVQVETEFSRSMTEHVEEIILEREQRALRKRQQKGEAQEAGASSEQKKEPEWHLPEHDAPAGLQPASKGTSKKGPGSKPTKGSTAAQTQKQLAQLEARRGRTNKIANALAVKALSMLQKKISSLEQCRKITARVAEASGQAQPVQEALDHLRRWETCSRDYTAAFGLCPGGELKPLGYDKDEYQKVIAAAAELVKAVKAIDFEQKEAKRRAEDAAAEVKETDDAKVEAQGEPQQLAKDDTTEKEQPEVKRRRTAGKQPEKNAVPKKKL